MICEQANYHEMLTLRRVDSGPLRAPRSQRPDGLTTDPRPDATHFVRNGSPCGLEFSAAMLAAVNEELARLGNTPVSLQDVQEAEWFALGHVDYPISAPSAALNSFRGRCSPSPLEDW